MQFKLASFVAAIGLAAAPSAFAADMPAKAPVFKAPMAVATPWTGFYVNGGIGYGAWAADQTVLDSTTGACIICETQVHGGQGWLATVGAGYDYQFAPRIVAGVFGDASISSLKGTLEDRAAGVGVVGEVKQTSSWATGARVGWLVTPKTLSYVNGGYTGARFSGTDTVFQTAGAPSGFSTPAFTASGWFLGGGIETSFAPGWFWRNEYRYSYYGSKTLDETPAGHSITFKPTVQTVTSQLVYKFNPGLPAPTYPAMPEKATNWTGFYVNAGAGYGIWTADSQEFPIGSPTCFICVNQKDAGKGYLGRFGAGYDWQFAPAWLVGAFGDFDISNLKGIIQHQQIFGYGTIKQTSAWAGGVRFGWLPERQTLTYVNGGYTGARFSDTTTVSMTNGVPGVTTPAFTTSGWFAGGGVETTFDLLGMLGKGWFWRTEYRYASYRDNLVTPAGATVDISFKPVVQTVTSSLIFKLN